MGRKKLACKKAIRENWQALKTGSFLLLFSHQINYLKSLGKLMSIRKCKFDSAQRSKTEQVQRSFSIKRAGKCMFIIFCILGRVQGAENKYGHYFLHPWTCPKMQKIMKINFRGSKNEFSKFHELGRLQAHTFCPNPKSASFSKLANFHELLFNK